MPTAPPPGLRWLRLPLGRRVRRRRRRLHAPWPLLVRGSLFAPCAELHCRQGIASSLLRLIKKDVFRDRMLWIELHVDEKTDRSHEWLLSMYRKHNFLVLPRPQSAEYLLVCVDY